MPKSIDISSLLQVYLQVLYFMTSEICLCIIYMLSNMRDFNFCSNQENFIFLEVLDIVSLVPTSIYVNGRGDCFIFSLGDNNRIWRVGKWKQV